MEMLEGYTVQCDSALSTQSSADSGLLGMTSLAPHS